MSKPKRTKFATHPDVAKLNHRIVPIVRLPSGQRFDSALYNVFFKRIETTLMSDVRLDLITKLGGQVWEHVTKVYMQSLPSSFDFPQWEKDVTNKDGDYFGFRGVRSLSKPTEDYAGNGYTRFLVMLLVQSPAPNQIADAYDFANCNPDAPERTFHKHDSVARTLITHLATEFGAVAHYYLRHNAKGDEVTKQIIIAKNVFHQSIPTSNRVDVN